MEISQIKRVAIVGGTHGNEITGVNAVKYWEANPQVLTQQLGDAQVDLALLLANLKAIAANRRYLDRDLNRCFQFDELKSGSLSLYEECRAKAINQAIGFGGDAQADFIIDLHTTTSSMGNSIVITSLDPLVYQMAAYLSMEIPDLKVYYEAVSQPDSPYLFSIARQGGVLIEIGPTPQGVLRADVYQKTQRAVEAALRFIGLYNQRRVPLLPEQITGYQYHQSLSLPTDEQGELNGMIHESLQDRDFQPLKKGDALFRLLDGTEEFFEPETDELFYPVFINEAAYYDRLMGVSLLKAVMLSA